MPLGLTNVLGSGIIEVVPGLMIWTLICFAITFFVLKRVAFGPIQTAIDKRPLPLGAVIGHDHAAVSDTYEAVENDDYAAFSAEFENGAGSVEVSRVAAGHANSLSCEVFCEYGSAKFDQRRPGEIQLFLHAGSGHESGYRQVIYGPGHPYIAGGLAMDAPEVGFGQNDAFAYQSRAFLEEVAGLSGIGNWSAVLIGEISYNPDEVGVWSGDPGWCTDRRRAPGELAGVADEGRR